MTKIMLVGYAPPTLLKNTKAEAAHYRTWQFLEPLLQDGHDVLLCFEPAALNDTGGMDGFSAGGNFDYRVIPFQKWGWIKALQKAHDEFQPDCVIGVNYRPCLYLTRLMTDRPIWMDIYGDPITIMQAASYRAGSNRGLPTEISFMHQVLMRGDVFSVCGELQSHMLVGELAMAGRLDCQTFGYQFARVILPGAPRLEAPEGPAVVERTRQEIGLKETDFVVLWCGGYNTWTDVSTLFNGLEWAMERNPNLVFLSVGGSTYAGQDNQYECFVKQIEASPHRYRFHLLGWQPWEKIPSFYQVSEVGLNIDAWHYETVYGTRTRLLEMMGAGLPVITSLGSELSYQLKNSNLASIFEIGDCQGLGEQIQHHSTDEAFYQQQKQNVLKAVCQEFSFAATTKPLRDWVKAPECAPDRMPIGKKESRRFILHQTRAKVRQLIWQAFGFDH
jgi:glycosyltransferase involved in cell wall biosynthesis